MSFMKRFEPFDWFYRYRGEYLADTEGEIQNGGDLIDWLKSGGEKTATCIRLPKRWRVP